MTVRAFILLLLPLAACAAAPLSASIPPGSSEVNSPARAVVALAQREFAGCHDDVCKTFAADLWLLRKRVATTEELRSMAVQVEQGDEACLCGRTNPTETAIDRQAQLLAEAVLLYRLAGDEGGAVFCLNRLRNVVAKDPANLGIAELLVRTVALHSGDKAALRDAATISPEAARAHVVLSAAESRALPGAVRLGLIRDVQDSAPKESRMAVLRGLERAGASEAADAYVDTIPAVERGRFRAALLRLRRPAPTTRLPPTPRLLSSPGTPRDQDSDAQPAPAAADAIADAIAIARAAEDTAANLTADRITALAQKFAPGADRLAFLTGAAKALTQSSERVRYEDLLVVHPMP